MAAAMIAHFVSVFMASVFVKNVVGRLKVKSLRKWRSRGNQENQNAVRRHTENQYFCVQCPIFWTQNHPALKYATYFLFLIVVLAPACKSLKRAGGGATLKPRSEKVLMKRLLDNQVNAEWLGAKAKVSYSDEYGRETFSTNIRIRKDSAIWIVFKKFSIEGARALITPDSIYVLDRLNREYAVKPFEYAQREYNLPVGFQGLQALLLGNPVFFSQQTEAGVDSTRYVLSQKNDRMLAKYWLNGAKMFLEEFFIDDFRNSRRMSVFSSNYQPLEDKQNFSYFRSLNLKSQDLGEMNIEIEFTKVEINVPQKIEFEIPDRYERVD